MVRPASFGSNEQTAASNSFQQSLGLKPEELQERAVKEFDAMVALLRENGIEVLVFQDTDDQVRPDAVFPNNWMSVQEDGTLCLYPMLTPNRRTERRTEFVEAIMARFDVRNILDFSSEELSNRIVEGTGSLVFDHVNRIAYACRSPRTDESLTREICAKLGYRPVIVNAVDERGLSIYHTNVVMCVGEKFAAVCLDAIRNDDDQEQLLTSLAETGHKVIAISYAQMSSFAGNMLEVQNDEGEPFVLLSQTAFNSLLPGQVDAITRYADLLPIPIPVIETCGGGSVRCMVGGIHAAKK